MPGVHAVVRSDDIDIVTVSKVQDEPGIAYRIFSSLADGGVDVDLILQTATTGGRGDIVFTVHKNLSYEAERILLSLDIGAGITVRRDVCKITVAGDGMQGNSGVCAEVFRCLSDAGIRIINISTSEIKISLLVSREDALCAYDSLTKPFDIEI